MGQLFSETLNSVNAIQLICPARVSGINIETECTTVTVERESGGATRLTARLLVVADGRNSTARELLGISSSEHDYRQTAIITNITPQRHHANTAYERFTPRGPLAMLPMSEERCAVVWSLNNEHLDAVMGLDNVLAVAGAAHGNFLLVVIGLLISIPIVIWGSQLILKYVERYPAIVYIGGAVLAWTAAKMIISEPLVNDYLAAYPVLAPMIYMMIIGGVMGLGFWANHASVRARVAGHIADAGEAAALPAAPGVKRVLLPVDTSANSLQAVEHVIGRHAAGAAMEVHLLHVRAPLSQYLARFISRGDSEAYHRQEAERALAPARDMLSRSGVPHTNHVEFGDKAETINAVAKRLGMQQIVMGTARKNSITRVVEDSLTNRVLEIVEVPVEIVVGRAVSRIEKFGLPAGMTAALAVLIAISLQ